jgi:putative acetyltransferase
LVAENVGQVIGHILFSPVTIATAPQCRLMGLGPMAVAAEHRNRGVGTALVEAGLKELRRLGAHGIVVVGHPTYYPRFGFSPGEKSNLACEYDVPTEVFMVMELHRGAMLGVSGTVKYHEAFGNA